MASGHGSGATYLPTDLIASGKVCRLVGCHPSTLRLYAETGKLPAYRIAGRHRRWSRREVVEYVTGESQEREARKILTYSRVSTSKQGKLKEGQSDLIRQEQRLNVYAQENYPGVEIVNFADIGSGMNMLRKNMRRMIDQILAGVHDGSTLIIENRDRLTRFGYELIEMVCASHKIEVVYIAQTECSDDELLVADLLAITTIYSSRLYGGRVRERMSKKLSVETIQRGKELVDAGHSIQKAIEILYREGHRCEDGDKIRFNIFRKNIYCKRGTLEKVMPTKLSSAAEWKNQCLEPSERVCVLPIHRAYEHYVSWAGKKKLLVVTKKRFVNEIGLQSHQIRIPELGRQWWSWRGYVIKGVTVHIRKKEKDKGVLTGREILLKFCDQLRGFKGNKTQAYLKYVDYCKRLDVRPFTRSPVVNALKTLGFWKGKYAIYTREH